MRSNGSTAIYLTVLRYSASVKLHRKLENNCHSNFRILRKIYSDYQTMTKHLFTVNDTIRLPKPVR